MLQPSVSPILLCPLKLVTLPYRLCNKIWPYILRVRCSKSVALPPHLCFAEKYVHQASRHFSIAPHFEEGLLSSLQLTASTALFLWDLQ